MKEIRALKFLLYLPIRLHGAKYFSSIWIPCQRWSNVIKHYDCCRLKHGNNPIVIENTNAQKASWTGNYLILLPLGTTWGPIFVVNRYYWLLMVSRETSHGTRHVLSQTVPKLEPGEPLAVAVGKSEQFVAINVLWALSFIAKLEEIGVRMTVSEDSIFSLKNSPDWGHHNNKTKSSILGLQPIVTA